MSERVQASDLADVPPGYNTPIPPRIMTPDRVDTRIGELEFVDGVPTSETARRSSTTSTSAGA